MAKTARKLILFVILFGLSACSKTYKIGDIGPAGGIIFFDKGKETEGWRYLEAAPESYEFTAPWGFSGVAVSGTETGIGYGKTNTEIIVSMTSSERADNAAYRCSMLEINGFNDWFLPSKDELDLMFQALYRRNNDPYSHYRYWSSSVGKDERFNTWRQRFSDGNQSYSGDRRHIEIFVRAVRAF